MGLVAAWAFGACCGSAGADLDGGLSRSEMPMVLPCGACSGMVSLLGRTSLGSAGMMVMNGAMGDSFVGTIAGMFDAVLATLRGVAGLLCAWAAGTFSCGSI